MTTTIIKKATCPRCGGRNVEGPYAKRTGNVPKGSYRCEECDKPFKANVKLPKTLARSEAYYDDPKGAIDLWNAGFRPMRARKLAQGMEVAYRDTDIFQMQAVGPVRYSRVLGVRQPDATSYPELLLVSHTGGDTEVEEGEEVWAK